MATLRCEKLQPDNDLFTMKGFAQLVMMLALYLVLANSCKASDFSIITGSWSNHADYTKDYRQDHHALGFQHGEYTAFTFLNSNDDRSYFAGRTKNRWHLSDSSSFGYTYGLITGYAKEAPLPLILPKYTFEKKRFAIDFHYLPTVVLEARFRIKLP